jgi:hypothetical protein
MLAVIDHFPGFTCLQENSSLLFTLVDKVSKPFDTVIKTDGFPLFSSFSKFVNKTFPTIFPVLVRDILIIFVLYASN